MPNFHSPGLGLVAAAAAIFALAGCDLPLGLGLASTRALENGAAGGLSNAGSFEMKGSYSGPDAQWTVDMQLVRRPLGEHIVAGATSTSGGPAVKLESIVIGDVAYYRGQEFLAQNLGRDALSQSIVRSAGNSWWKGPSALLPQLPDFTDGPSFRSTFLGPVVTRRIDHTSVDGTPAVEMSSPRADVFISAVEPHQLLRVHLVKGATVDAISEADFRYTNFNQDFQIKPPPDVIDFSNLSTLPPTYTVVSVDASGCGSPCLIAATLKNLGGTSGARAPSTVTFTVTDPASGMTAGSCQAQVVPDVGYNSTTNVSCTISDLNTQQLNAATVTATVDNPGRA